MNYERSPLSNDEACKDTDLPKPTFKVAIIYDQRCAATRAMHLFRNLVRELGGEFDFQCDLWRCDVLGLLETQEAAGLAGRAADLVIVAVSCDSDLRTVQDWLDRSMAEKAPGSAALVALLESHHRLSDVQCRTRQLLQSVADHNRMDLFLHEVDLPELSLGPKTIQSRANTVSSVLEGILHRPERPPRFEGRSERNCERDFV